MKKPNFKKQKFEDRLLSEVNRILRENFSDSRLTFVSVTKVELNVDFSVAKLFWDTFDQKLRTDAEKAVNSIAPRIRKLLAGALDVRHVPEISFVYDSQYEDEARISAILEQEKTQRGEGVE